MKLYSFSIMVIAPLIVTDFWLTWWFNIIIIVMAIIAAVIYHNIKMKAARNEKAEMERRMNEKSELLIYSKGNEKKAREEADMANKSKSILLSKITHEIRTPMNSIMGMAALLNDGCVSPEQCSYTASVLQSGDELLTLINDILMQDILEYSKIDSGKELELKEFDLRNSLEEVMDVFASKAVAAGIDLIYNIDDNVHNNLVGDAYRLRQVLMNLIENSFRFTTSGDIFVGVKLINTTSDNRVDLEFEVKDTGSGMTSERLQIISKDLNQADTSETIHKALGLTLIICKKLVGLMGGSIKVESKQNEGTSFKFNIRIQVGLQPNRNTQPNEMASLAGKKVLIVDDNETVLSNLQNHLSKWNCKVEAARSGEEALALVKSVPNFDLVLTDLQMPGMDGIMLTKSIKHLQPALPVILLNNPGDESFRQYTNLFIAHVNKPLKQHLVSKHIASALRQKVTLDSAQKQKRKLSVEFAKQHPLRILVGEDDAMNQMVVKMVLSKLGYDIVLCKNGQEVLEEVSQNRYDVILMDVQMPEMDGLEATRMIRLCLTEQPVIIAMTANTLQGDREMCLAAGMDDYIGKPVKLEEIVDLLEKWSLQVHEYHQD